MVPHGRADQDRAERGTTRSRGSLAVTLDTTNHHDIAAAARASLLSDLNIIATKCEHDADDNAALAVELQQRVADLHADETFKRAKAAAAREAITRMHTAGVAPTSHRQRANELVALARAVNDDDPGDNARFAELTDAVRVHDGLASGGLDWREEYPELKGTVAPRDIAVQAADEKVRDLVWHIVFPDDVPCTDCRRCREWWTPAVHDGAPGAALCEFHIARRALDAKQQPERVA